MIGETESIINDQLLAQEPDAPLSAPVTDPAVTSINTIKVTWQPITQDGSSPILSYSLEIDDGTGADFTPVVGHLTNYLLLHYTISDNIT